MPKPIIFGVSSEFLKRDGLTETIATWEDGLRINTGPGTFEWWYFDAHFDDGSTAVIVFATKPLIERDSPLKPDVSLTITRPNGTKIMSFHLSFPPTNSRRRKKRAMCASGRTGHAATMGKPYGEPRENSSKDPPYPAN